MIFFTLVDRNCSQMMLLDLDYVIRIQIFELKPDPDPKLFSSNKGCSKMFFWNVIQYQISTKKTLRRVKG